MQATEIYLISLSTQNSSKPHGCVIGSELIHRHVFSESYQFKQRFATITRLFSWERKRHELFTCDELDVDFGLRPICAKHIRHTFGDEKIYGCQRLIRWRLKTAISKIKTADDFAIESKVFSILSVFRKCPLRDSKSDFFVFYGAAACTIIAHRGWNLIEKNLLH